MSRKELRDLPTNDIHNLLTFSNYWNKSLYFLVNDSFHTKQAELIDDQCSFSDLI